MKRSVPHKERSPSRGSHYVNCMGLTWCRRLLSIAMIKTLTRNSLERKVFIWLTGYRPL